MTVERRLVGGLGGQAGGWFVLDVGHLRPQQGDAASDLDKAGHQATASSRELHKLLGFHKICHHTLAEQQARKLRLFFL